MSTWQQDAAAAARRYGLDPNVFTRQMGQEAHGADLTSPAGAQGPAQFMPGTAQSVGLTSTTVHQRVPSYNAAAKLMAGYVHQYGSYAKALTAYNAGPGAVGRALPAETQNYIKTILGGSTPSTRGVTTSGGSSTGASSIPAPSSNSLLGQPSLQPQAGGQDFSSLLSSLLSQSQPQASSSSLGASPTATSAPFAQGARPLLASSSAPASAQDRVSAALSLAQALGGPSPTLGSNQQSTTADGLPATTTDTHATASGAVKAGISPHAKPGDPVVSSSQSIGGLHPTEGLAGFPAHDYFAPAGSHAVSPVSGKIIKLSGHDPSQGPIEGPHGPFGWSVYIQGSDGKTYFLTHLGSRNVKVGQSVQQGQIIGTVGDYAKYGTPSHIHQGVNG